MLVLQQASSLAQNAVATSVRKGGIAAPESTSGWPESTTSPWASAWASGEVSICTSKWLSVVTSGPESEDSWELLLQPTALTANAPVPPATVPRTTKTLRKFLIESLP